MPILSPQQPNMIAEQLQTQSLLQRLQQLQAELSLTRANQALQAPSPPVASPNLLGMAIEPGAGRYPQMTAPPPSANAPTPQELEAAAWGRMQPSQQFHVLNPELPALPLASPAAKSQLRSNAMLQDPAYQQYAANVDQAKATAAAGQTPTHPGYLVGSALNRQFPVYTDEQRADIESKRGEAVKRRDAELSERKLRVKAKAMGKEPVQVDMEQRMLAGQEPGLMDILMAGGPEGLVAANARDPQVQMANMITALGAAGAQNPAGFNAAEIMRAAEGLSAMLGIGATADTSSQDMAAALEAADGDPELYRQLRLAAGATLETVENEIAQLFPQQESMLSKFRTMLGRPAPLNGAVPPTRGQLEAIQGRTSQPSGPGMFGSPGRFGASY